MPEPRDDRPIDGFELLSAPPRSDLERAAARRAILAAAAPLLARRRPASSWDVLAGWARPGLVAASIALAVAVGALQLGPSRGGEPAPVALDEVLVGEGGGAAALAMFIGTQEPDADAVMAAALLERGAESPPPTVSREREQR